MTSTFHNSLRARQRQTGAEPLHHGEVAVTVEQVPELGKAKFFLELRVLTPCNVEVKSFLGFPDQLNVKTAAGRPDAGDLLHRTQIFSKCLRPSRSSFRASSMMTSRAISFARSFPIAR